MIDISVLNPAVVDSGNDVLRASVTLPDGEVLEGAGHVSATTNHYDNSAYSTDVNGSIVRDPKAKARAMTPAEVGHYAMTLIVEQNAGRIAQLAPDETATVKTIAFTLPADSDVAAALAKLVQSG